MTSSGGGSTPRASAGARVGQQVDPEDLRRQQRHRHGLARRRRRPMAPAQHDAEEHRQHLADVRRQQVAKELADVGEDAAPLATAATIVAKLSSARIMSAASFATSVPVMPIATPMSAAFSAGRVVHAVAGHGDDVAVGLERVDDAQLVLGRDAREDRRLAHRSPRAPRRRGRSSSAPVSDRAPASRDARARRRSRAAVRGWSPVIMTTRMPARARLGDRRPRLGARRVDHPDHAEEDELALDRSSAGARLASARAAR